MIISLVCLTVTLLTLAQCSPPPFNVVSIRNSKENRTCTNEIDMIYFNNFDFEYIELNNCHIANLDMIQDMTGLKTLILREADIRHKSKLNEKITGISLMLYETKLEKLVLSIDHHLFYWNLPSTLRHIHLRMSNLKLLKKEIFANMSELVFLKLDGSSELDEIILDFKLNESLNISLMDNKKLKKVILSQTDSSKKSQIKLDLHLGKSQVKNVEYKSTFPRFLHIIASDHVTSFHQNSDNKKSNMCSFWLYLYNNKTMKITIQREPPYCFDYKNDDFNNKGFNNFADWSSTIQLEMRYLKLQKMPDLNKLKNLRTLDLSYNEITELKSLNLLPLSLVHLNLENNRIHSIDKEFFYNQFRHLIVLRLGFNNLASLRKIDGEKLDLTALKVLQELYMNHCYLTELDTRYFFLPQDVRSINFSNNKISYISQDFFKKLVNISSIDVSNNSLAKIEQLFFNHDSTSLTKINFANNPISGSYVGFESHTLQLTRAELFENLCFDFKAGTVKIEFSIGTTNFNIINKNRVINITIVTTLGPDERVPKLNKLLNGSLQNSEEVNLNLSNIQLDHMPVLAVYNVKSLNVSKNKIVSLENSPFLVINIENLDFSYNNISSIGQRFFAGLKNLRTINFVGNPVSLYSFNECYFSVNSLETISFDKTKATFNFRTLIKENVNGLCSMILYLNLAKDEKMVSTLYLKTCRIEFSRLNYKDLIKSEPDITDNKIISIEIDSTNLTEDRLLLKSFIDLRNLTIRNCTLGILNSTTMQLPASLERLLLTDNYIQSIDREQFSNLTNLVYLNISSKFAANIWTDSFYNFSKQRQTIKYSEFMQSYFKLSNAKCEFNMHQLIYDLDNVKLFKVTNLTVSFYRNSLNNLALESEDFLNLDSFADLSLFNLQNEYFDQLGPLLENMIQKFIELKLEARFAPSLEQLNSVSKFDFDLSSKRIASIPNLAKFNNLIELDLSRNELETLNEPENIPSQIESLDFSLNKIAIVDNLFFVKFVKLRQLLLSGNRIKTIESLYFNTASLVKLNVSNNTLYEVVDVVLTGPVLRGITFDFSQNNLTQFPTLRSTNSYLLPHTLDIRQNQLELEALCKFNSNETLTPFSKIHLFPQNSSFNCQQLVEKKAISESEKGVRMDLTECMPLSQFDLSYEICPPPTISFLERNFNIILDLAIMVVCFYIFMLVVCNRYQPPPSKSVKFVQKPKEIYSRESDLQTRTHNSIDLYKKSSVKKK